MLQISAEARNMSTATDLAHGSLSKLSSKFIIAHVSHAIANEVNRGNSTVLQEITKPTGIGGFWQTMTTGAKSGLVIGAVAGAGVLLAALLVCCVVQARKGKKEKAVADAQWDKEQAEFNQYRMQMMNGGFSKGGFSAPQVQPVHPGYTHQGPPHGGKF
jgi:hypothetical protein